MKKILFAFTLLISLLLSVLVTFRVAHNKGENEGFSMGEESGFIDGRVAGDSLGWKRGFTEGKVAGAENMRKVLEVALTGAPLLLADKELENELVDHTLLHHLSNSKDQPIIKAEVKSYARHVNKLIVERFIQFGDFSRSDIDTIYLKFKQEEERISDLAYAKYRENLSKIDGKNLSLNKAKSLSRGMADVLCEIIDLLNPLQKLKLAKALLEAGNKRNRKEIGKTTILINHLAMSYVSDQLCHLIANNSLELVMTALLDYATIVDFTEQDLVGKHTMVKVMELVTARNDLKFTLNRTYERKYRVDPNYVLSCDAHVTAGVNLAKYYCIEFYPKEITDNGRTQIVVTIPEPEILSVHPSIYPTSMNTLFSRNLRDYEIQQAYREVSVKAKNLALNEGILADAREGTIEAINIIYAPLFYNSGKDYQVIVRFSNSGYNGDAVVLKG